MIHGFAGQCLQGLSAFIDRMLMRFIKRTPHLVANTHELLHVLDGNMYPPKSVLMTHWHQGVLHDWPMPVSRAGG